MNFENLATIITTLAPASVSHVLTSSTSMYFKYTDGTKDILEIEISMVESIGDEIIVAKEKGTVWYFAPEFCHWLGMTSRLVADYRQEKSKNAPF